MATSDVRRKLYELGVQLSRLAAEIRARGEVKP